LSKVTVFSDPMLAYPPPYLILPILIIIILIWIYLAKGEKEVK
jgi:hypothetical protein